MRNKDNRALVIVKVMFQPGDGFSVQVVGGLIEKKDIRFREKQAAESRTAPLSPGKTVDKLIVGRAAQRFHGQIDTGIEGPAVALFNFFLDFSLPCEKFFHGVVVHGFGKSGADLVVFGEETSKLTGSFIHRFPNGFAGGELRFLGKITHSYSVGHHTFAIEVFFEAGHDFQKGGFSRPVGPDNADFGTKKETQGDIREHGSGTVAFTRPDQ